MVLIRAGHRVHHHIGAKRGKDLLTPFWGHAQGFRDTLSGPSVIKADLMGDFQRKCMVAGGGASMLNPQSAFKLWKAERALCNKLTGV